MNEVTAHLVVQQGPHPNREYTLAGSHIIIGRAHTSDIGITDSKVSRQHAQITRDGGLFTIQDLGSTNGTFVNGRRIEAPTPLADGDSINLGETIRLTFQTAASLTPAAPIASPSPQEFSAVSAQPTIDEFSLKSEGGLDLPDPIKQRSGRRPWIIILLLLLLVFICAATFFFLDAYEGGKLLYCGPAQPIFDAILGLFDAAPNC